MNLKKKFVLYLAALHVLFIVLSILVLQQFGWWFFLLEALFLFSLFVGYRLVGWLLEPLEFLKSGSDILQEEDFSIRFREVGQSEMDRLIEIYNQMLMALQHERLRAGEQRGVLDALLRATPIGILTFDFDALISMANPSAGVLLGCDPDKLVGRSLNAVNGQLADALAGLAVGQNRMVALPGGRRLRCRRSVFHDRGFVRSFILIEELTEELRRSERSAYEKLIRIMSHEVNNTVGATNSLLQSCLRYSGQLSPNDRQDYDSALSVVISRNESLNAFMQEFAGIVRLPPPVPQDVNLVQLIERVGVLMSGQCRERRIKWAWQIHDDPGTVRMDQDLMEQVFVNIVKNAIEAIEHDGTITVALAERNGAVELEIIDSGGALTPEVRDQVFTPFFTTKREGNGIGLTLVHEVLTRHGFAFFLDGQPGRETRFCISFPR